MYIIYKLTSPSGRYYIGLTKSALKERWRQHVKKSKNNTNHPLYNAIRRYGAESFVVEQIDSCDTRKQAQTLEMKHIASSQSDRPYNLSAGGEADGEAGSKIFWDAINADPTARAKYIAKLSEVKKANDWTDYADLAAKGAKWRKDNPRLAWSMSWRGIRIARRSKKQKEPDTRPLIEILRWKHNPEEALRLASKGRWSRASDKEREVMLDGYLKWRRDNPRMAWKIGYRSIRIANRTTKAQRTPKEPDTRPLIEKLRWKHNRSEACRISATRSWSEYTEEKREDIAQKISAAQTAFHATLTPEEKSKKTEFSRSCIDRSIQGPAASRGIKKFWEEIKKDPARYAEYMKARTASLMKTIEIKKCVPSTS